MIRLRKILLCDFIYYIFFLFTIFLVFLRVNYKHISYIDIHKNNYFKIVNYRVEGDKLSIKLCSSDCVSGTYYFDTKGEVDSFQNNFYLGDMVKVYGTYSKAKTNSVFGLFNYKKYLERNNIYYLIKIDNLKLINHSLNPYYLIKNKINNMCMKNPYLETFIFGKNEYISKDVLESFRENGISHLFAISGMHISLLSVIILKIFKCFKVREENSFIFTSCFLFFYLILVGFSASILRGVLFFILFGINNIKYFYIKSINLFLVIISISLLINPFYIYDVGFLYSYVISLSLIMMGDYINRFNGYFKKLFLTSLISFISSIPISLYSFNQINLLSIIYNLFYVPYVSSILFPISLIHLFINVPFYNSLILILEKSSLYLSKINNFKFIFKRVNFIFYLIYYFFIILFFYGLKSKKYFCLCFLFIFIAFHYSLSYISSYYVVFIDVGQGDSILVHLGRKNILIDTGGAIEYKRETWRGERKNSIVDNTTIPYLKSLGIKKIDYFVASHGDYDHLGEAINLVNNFKVEKVIFNCGRFNFLEKELIKVLDKKEIKYYSCIKKLTVDEVQLQFLQTKDFGNENDNSNVIYTELDGYKFMFMGDASIKTEKEILKEYELPNIDILKVGHHGSRTSSSKEFIDELNPKYALISVGENNKFNHPNKEVLENLNNSKIYRTDKDGSIMFKIKNSKLKIETCSP